MDADVRHAGLQHQERERAVHHLRQLRPQRQPVRPRRHGQQPGERETSKYFRLSTKQIFLQVDQPMVRIKRDTDDTETQGHAGSPDSCRGILPTLSYLCLYNLSEIQILHFTSNKYVCKNNLAWFLCVTCHVTSCDGGVMLGPGWRGRLMSAIMPGINTRGTL